MKKINAALVISLFVMTGCGGNKQLTDDCITVDVSADYPKKELILQDFMDVEYVPLETTDDFITQGIVKATARKFCWLQTGLWMVIFLCLTGLLVRGYGRLTVWDKVVKNIRILRLLFWMKIIMKCLL